MKMISFRSSSKANKNKSKKLLNLLTKPMKESISKDNHKENELEIDNELNEVESSENEDKDEDMTEVTGIPYKFITKKYFPIMILY